MSLPKRFLFSLSISFLLLPGTPARAENRHVTKLLQKFSVLPVHVNGSVEEYSLVAGGVRVGQYAVIAGKYVALPLMLYVFAAGLNGWQIDVDRVAALGVGISAIMGTQAMAFNYLSEPLLVKMPPEELLSILKAGSPMPPFYFLRGLKFREKKLLNHIIKGRFIDYAEGEKTTIERISLDGSYEDDNRFTVTSVHGLEAIDRKTVSLKDMSCGGILARAYSTLH